MKKSANILVIGDLMIDEYLTGEINRISPEAPVPVLHVTNQELKLGGAANLANNLAGLVDKVHLLGVVGNDQMADELERLLALNGIGKDLFVSNQHPTTTKTRIVAGNQQVVRVDKEKILKETTFFIEDLKKILASNSWDFLIVSDYNKGVISERVMAELRRYSSENNSMLFVDPKGKNWSIYKDSFLVKPNFAELQDIFGQEIKNTDSEIENAGKQILRKLNLKYLLVTRSEKGMTLISDFGVEHFDTVPNQVFDVSGAGDTVLATLVFELSKNSTLNISVERAQKAAGYVISKFGTTTISREIYNELIQG